MHRMREILELARVRLLLFLREPEAMFWVFAFPLLLAAVLGFAFRKSQVQPARVIVLDGAGAEELAERLGRSPELAVERAADEESASRALRSGKVDALVRPGDPPLVRFDEARTEAAVARLALELALARPASGEPSSVALEPVRERGSRYVDFLLPGLLGMNLMGTGMWSIGFAVAELRQRKVLKRMLVTPMRRSSFLGSFLVARLVFLVVEVAALVVFGALVLGVPFRAGLAGFALLCLVGALSFAGLGMFVTSRVRTIQGASGMLNVAMMPMWLLSGVFFSYERFPELLQPILRLIPLTALNDALRGAMLDGRPASAFLAEFAVLLVWGLLSFLLAVRLFRWE